MYTYHCENCDHQFEKYQSFSENALTTCPNCQQETLFKVYKPALVVFKGKGFYVNDSKSTSSTLNSKSKDNHNSEDKPKTEKEESKKEETKKIKGSKEIAASE
jgi:putative FmdB family regulatory protein